MSDGLRLLLTENLGKDSILDTGVFQNDIKNQEMVKRPKQPIIVSGLGSFSSNKHKPKMPLIPTIVEDVIKEDQSNFLSVQENYKSSDNEETEFDEDRSINKLENNHYEPSSSSSPLSSSSSSSSSSIPVKSLPVVTPTVIDTVKTNKETVTHESHEFSPNMKNVPPINSIITGQSFNYNGGDNNDLNFDDNNYDNNYDNSHDNNDNSHDNNHDNNYDNRVIIEPEITVPTDDANIKQKIEDPIGKIPTKNIIIPTENIIPKVTTNDSKSSIDVKNSHDIDPILNAGNILPSLTGLISENASEEEDFNDMKNVLSNLQIVLLYLAGVTFLAILLYSVYYINLIRRIYAKKVSGFKRRTSGRNSFKLNL